MEPRQTLAHQSLFEQLRRALLEKIATGQWAPGDRVPSEQEIADEYGLSQGTVRRAMDFLENNKFVIRQQGRGTHVLGASSRELMQRFERFRADDLGSLEMTLEVLSHEEGEATDIEAQQLKLRGVRLVRRITRLRRSRGKPFLYEQIALPAALFPAAKDNDNPEFWIFTTARNCGALLGDAEEKISVEPCPATPANWLNVETGAMVMRVRGVMHTINGKPARWRDAYAAGSGIHYSVALTRSG